MPGVNRERMDHVKRKDEISTTSDAASKLVESHGGHLTDLHVSSRGSTATKWSRQCDRTSCHYRLPPKTQPCGCFVSDPSSLLALVLALVLAPILDSVAAITSPLSKSIVAHFRTTPLGRICVGSSSEFLPCVALSDAFRMPAPPPVEVFVRRTAWATTSPSGTQRAKTFVDASRSSSATYTARFRQVTSSATFQENDAGVMV